MTYYAKIKVDPTKAEEVKDFYGAEEIKDEKRPYDYFETRKGTVVVKAYRNRKEVYTIVFSGPEEVLDEARLFSEDVTLTKSEASTKPAKEAFASWEDLSSQIGSDEVGVGDFFGPLIVVASAVDEKDIPYLERMKVNDSKKMNDDYILEIGPALQRHSRSYACLLSPGKLSEVVTKGSNVHKVMALLHNHAQAKLKEKYGLDDRRVCYVDQFESEALYLRHVGADRIPNPLYFRTKGETYFPSVALSSVLARYLFLKEWKAMEKALGAEIPKGASALVDKTYALLVKERGLPAVSSYVKKYFRNYTKD